MRLDEMIFMSQNCRSNITWDLAIAAGVLVVMLILARGMGVFKHYTIGEGTADVNSSH